MGHKNQFGFSTVIGIIAIALVVGVLGLIGWRLYNQPSAKTNGATSNNTSTSKTTVTNPTTPPATLQPIYLDIKELGIKIQLDDSIKDATYSAHTNSDGSQYAYISTTSLTNASNGSCSAQKGGFASVSETKGAPPQVFGTTLQPNNTTVFKLGTDTYVYIGSPNGSSYTEDPTASALFPQQKQTFFNDFKTVQSDN